MYVGFYETLQKIKTGKGSHNGQNNLIISLWKKTLKKNNKKYVLS